MKTAATFASIVALAAIAPPACRTVGGGKEGGLHFEPARASVPITWTCTGSPCPWGASMTGHAIVWPATAAASNRLGYTTSAPIYLGAREANGLTISLTAGSATVYAGSLNTPAHRVLAALTTDSPPQLVTGVAPGEVMSVLGNETFSYATAPPLPDPVLASDVPPGQVVRSVSARWYCASSSCNGEPWPGAVIPWPAWAAVQGNGRSGDQGRLVYAKESGRPLYAYMGAWANGCRITARSGRAEVVEWRHGDESWRRTFLNPGETHVVQLKPPENGALIEAPEGVTEFSVSLESCTPPRPAPPATAP